MVRLGDAAAAAHCYFFSDPCQSSCVSAPPRHVLSFGAALEPPGLLDGSICPKTGCASIA
jgi:hypothetical protein